MVVKPVKGQLPFPSTDSFQMQTLFALTAVVAALAAAVPSGNGNEQMVLAAEKPDMRLIETAPYVQEWKTPSQVLELVKRGQHFMDVTDHPDLGVPSFMAQSTLDLPRSPRVPALVYPMLTKLSNTRCACIPTA